MENLVKKIEMSAPKIGQLVRKVETGGVKVEEFGEEDRDGCSEKLDSW